MTYAVERLSEVWQEVAAILPEHWEHIGGDKEWGPLEVDWDSYLAMDRAGMVHLLTVRDRAVIVGYCLSFLRSHLHCKSVLTAYNDYYYLKPAYRGFAGAKMLAEVEKSWRQLGVKKATIACKNHLDHGRMFERMDWKWAEKVFLKELA